MCIYVGIYSCKGALPGDVLVPLRGLPKQVMEAPRAQGSEVGVSCRER